MNVLGTLLKLVFHKCKFIERFTINILLKVVFLDNINLGQFPIKAWKFANLSKKMIGNCNGLLTEREVCTVKYQTEVF
jgi:hypothetical protein